MSKIYEPELIKGFNIHKIYGPCPKDVFDAIKMHSEVARWLIDALFIMQSTIEYPDCLDINLDRMNKFLKQFEYK